MVTSALLSEWPRTALPFTEVNCCVLSHLQEMAILLLLHMQGCCNSARAAYNVRRSCGAFMDEAVLWHADCGVARFQVCCSSCTPDATKVCWLELAVYPPLLSPSAHALALC